MTDDTDPFELLRSSRPSDRLRGARIARTSNLAWQRLADLRRLRATETDTFVVAALDRAVAHIAAAGANANHGESWITTEHSADLADVRAEAIQTVTRTVLHEIRPLVSEVFRAARDELDDRFDESTTAKSIQRLGHFLDLVERLWKASSSPRASEFDLADLIASEISVGGFEDRAVIATRPDPVIVIGDPDLLRLALQNVLRNAVEASVMTHTPVVVNCASSERDAWIVILDEGVGLPDAAEKVWEPGVTRKSKEEHFGWGLAITQRAVDSMGGTVRLTPRVHGGVACEIRWQFALESEESREDSAD